MKNKHIGILMWAAGVFLIIKAVDSNIIDLITAYLGVTLMVSGIDLRGKKII